MKHLAWCQSHITQEKSGGGGVLGLGKNCTFGSLDSTHSQKGGTYLTCLRLDKHRRPK